MGGLSGGDNISANITGDVSGQVAVGKDIDQRTVSRLERVDEREEEPRPTSPETASSQSSPAGRRWDVFVAYASPDRDRARVLHRELVRAGLSVFLDAVELRPGDNWHRELPRHLRSSTVVVTLVSNHTAGAEYANAEVILAVEQVRRDGIRLVPLRLHPGADLPYGTQGLQALDYFDDASTRRVVKAIVDVVRNPSTA